MDIGLTQLELIEMLLQEKKVDVLMKIKDLLNDSLNQDVDYSIVEERREKYLETKPKTYTWEEIKKELK